MVVAVLAVGFGTGSISFFFISDSSSPGVTPVDNIPQVGTPDNGVFQGPQLSFRYPAKWHILREPNFAVSGSPTGVTFLGIQTMDEVAVETMPLNTPVTSANFRELRGTMVRLMRQHAGTSNDGIIGGPIDTKLGGYPALEFDLQGPGPGGTLVDQRIVISAHGKTEYWIACFSTREHRAAIARGCDQILRTFRIGSAEGAAG